MCLHVLHLTSSRPKVGGNLKDVFKQSLSVQVCMQLPIQQSGMCNAIAFWFELDLDEQTQLSTRPYCKKVLPHYCFATFNSLLCPGYSISTIGKPA